MYRTLKRLLEFHKVVVKTRITGSVLCVKENMLHVHCDPHVLELIF